MIQTQVCLIPEVILLICLFACFPNMLLPWTQGRDINKREWRVLSGVFNLSKQGNGHLEVLLIHSACWACSMHTCEICALSYCSPYLGNGKNKWLDYNKKTSLCQHVAESKYDTHAAPALIPGYHLLVHSNSILIACAATANKLPQVSTKYRRQNRVYHSKKTRDIVVFELLLCHEIINIVFKVCI